VSSPPPERDYGPGDPSGMVARVVGAPAQIEAALAGGARAPWPPPAAAPDLIAVGGLGGSAVAADLSAALWADRMPHPLLTVRDYHWPACVTRASLAVLSSYSGETEETLALYAEAGARGVPRVAITAGGTLAERCARDGVPCARLPGGSPPRAALYSSWVALSRLLASAGWIDDPAPEWRAAAARLDARNGEWGPGVPENDNPAWRLARALRDRVPLIYAGGTPFGPVAARWRTQLNENAKLLGHSAVVPELNHNEIVGWERPRALGDRAVVVILRDAEDGDAIALRLTLTAEYAERQGAHVVDAEERDGGRLERMASMIHLGDYVSVYLALIHGVDPTAIASIDAFKRRLAERRQADGR